MTPPDSAFDKLQSADIRRERRIFWSEVALIAFLAVLVAGYLMVRWRVHIAL